MYKWNIIILLVVVPMLLIGCNVELEGMLQEQVDGVSEEVESVIKDAVKEATKNEIEAVKESATEEMNQMKEDATNLLSDLEVSIGLTHEIIEDDSRDVEEQVSVVKVYYPDHDMRQFLIEEVEVAARDSWIEEALEALIHQNVVPAEVSIVNYQEQDGLTTISLSQEYEDFLATLGTSGEYMYLGSMVNTFLEAGGVEKVMILIQDHYLETGHGIYEEPFTQYDW